MKRHQVVLAFVVMGIVGLVLLQNLLAVAARPEVVVTAPVSPAVTVSAAAATVPLSSTCDEPPPPPPPPKVLYKFSTKYKAGPKYIGRATNIELLVKKLDRRVISAGQTWSFNSEAGPRTLKAGFKKAPTYFAGEVVPGIGGGTCQVSSTVYAALLHTNVEIVDRRPHSRKSSYIPVGLDATVNYPAECRDKYGQPKDRTDPRVCYDLVFKNPYDGPIFLTLETSKELDEDGKKTLTVSILGYDNVVTPKVTTRWTGYNSPPFKTRYHKVSWWKDDRKQLKQSGRPGLSGARLITIEWLDGKTETKKVYSKYQPVPQVYQVGQAFEKPEPVEKDPPSGEAP